MILKTLLKKEFFELFKTKKFLILPIVLIIIGAISPFMAKYTPEIIKQFTNLDMSSLPDPTMKDSYLNLLKNLDQIGYLVILFISTNIFISDKTKGRLIMLISKPMQRRDILISKFISIIIQFTLSIVLASLFFIFYTIALFDTETFNILTYLGVISMYFLYGVFLISLSMFASTVSKTFMPSILITIFTYFTLSVLNMANLDIFYILPSKASSIENSILKNSLETLPLIINVFSSIFISAILIISSILIFKNQEIE